LFIKLLIKQLKIKIKMLTLHTKLQN